MQRQFQLTDVIARAGTFSRDECRSKTKHSIKDTVAKRIAMIRSVVFTRIHLGFLSRDDVDSLSLVASVVVSISAYKSCVF